MSLQLCALAGTDFVFGECHPFAGRRRRARLGIAVEAEKEVGIGPERMLTLARAAATLLRLPEGAPPEARG